MSQRTTTIRSLHDLGLAAWFGGSLMGAIGLNGAADSVTDRNHRAPVANAGWRRWAPVNAVAIGAHIVGGLGILLADSNRVRHQKGVVASSLVKTTLTAAAAAVTAYCGVLNQQIHQVGPAPADGSVSPASDTPEDLAQAQRRLQICQWALPALTGALIINTAVQSEQQRPSQQLRGIAHHSAERLGLTS